MAGQQPAHATPAANSCCAASKAHLIHTSLFFINTRQEDLVVSYVSRWVVQDFIEEGFLTLTAAPRPANQPRICRDCMDNHYDKFNWMAFIDLDEYIHMRRCAPAPPNCLSTHHRFERKSASLAAPDCPANVSSVASNSLLHTCPKLSFKDVEVQTMYALNKKL